MIGHLEPTQLASITTRLVDHVLVLHGFVAYLIVGLLCFGEAAIMLGFVIPGETAVVIGGVLASRHHVGLPLMVVVVVLCAIVGDSVGYEVGKHLGPRILSVKPLRKRAARIEQGQEFLRRRGMVGVFIGRFTALLRAMVPGLAGMSGMHYPKFLLANAAGGIIWGTMFTLLGYFVGQSIENLTGTASLVLLGAIGLLVLGLHVRSKARERRLAIAESQSTDEPGDHPPARRRGKREIG
jgi:membrane protein DedA with SNARE-associated domain